MYKVTKAIPLHKKCDKLVADNYKNQYPLSIPGVPEKAEQ